jgi:hypothetical protein
MNESPLTISLHVATLVSLLTLIGLVLKLGSPILREYKIWSRMKDRVNMLWFDRCKAKEDEYVPLENGRH